ncbi:serine/arginine-rich SC35-like splicing factor SCL30 isoform X2 [Telopea speciosissima]|uniref:serine/arginine-rich SC35-like splicing factor SCL30 isoform X2 n=1 Tax=Telopea speciosissima TaxID=54955 RepID=UPI001CC34602|nr:serine/arginine-rich SC35-like splicing factor SCL30 isoform X2 [Telopea speciosissima]
MSSSFLLFQRGKDCLMFDHWDFTMRRYSPAYHSPPRRGYGGRGRSPPRRRYGGYGGRREQNNGSLLVRNVPLNCGPEDLRVPFERFGPVRDVYLPKDYYTGEPRGFAFVQFVDPYDATEAQYHMNGQLFCGREITVVLAAETRKRPEEMRNRSRSRGPSGYGGQRSSYYGRSHSRSVSRSRSPRYAPPSRSRYRSRSYSPAPRQRGGYSISPRTRQADRSRSPRDLPPERDDRLQRRSYSPGYGDADRDHEKPIYDAEGTQVGWRSPGGASRSPSGSRSRSADLSPRHSR